MKQTKSFTPLMKQYHEIKSKYSDAIVLFRVGDFYETFGKDAIISSKILNIVLTKKNNGAASTCELAGFPHHALDNYMPKLVQAGYRVAVCEQLENPQQGKTIVKRGITEVITPGLSINSSDINNYLASIYLNKNLYGIAFLDISTGDFFLAEGNFNYINNLIECYKPSEILLSKKHKNIFNNLINSKIHLRNLEDWIYNFDFANEKILNHFNITSLKCFGIETMTTSIISSGAIFYYLEESKHNKISHIVKMTKINEKNHMQLDRSTLQNLEILNSQYSDGISLFQIIDQTTSIMGKRLLKKYLISPEIDIQIIKKRQNKIDSLFYNKDLLTNILKLLKEIFDLEKLAAKIGIQKINPRELNTLKNSLKFVTKIKNLIIKNKYLSEINNFLKNLESLITKIENNIKQEVPLNVNQGNIIKEGINEELDKFRDILKNSKQHIENFKIKEINNTGISSLKISYNKIFGYYIEVPNTHKNKVPNHWIRKQTLTNAERYITPEIKEFEETILYAQDRILVLESRIYYELVCEISNYIEDIQSTALGIAKIDVYCSLTILALQNHYVKPTFNNDGKIELKQARHPVIEKSLPIEKPFIPNDIVLDQNEYQIIIISGPNMAGKSAILRQVALINILAQIGSFVPATKANLCICDKIFSRVGANDNIAKGESTFMVEMTETAFILNNLTRNSLIILDEIGRGTSTYDGISIAKAIIEFLHNTSKRPKTLFATHYHELNDLTKEYNRIKNMNVNIKNIDGQITFLYKLIEGGSNHSFGINVAQIAGMPKEIISRAKFILNSLSKNNHSEIESKNYEKHKVLLSDENFKYKTLKTYIENLKIENISPLEALVKLNELKNIMNNIKKDLPTY